MCLGGDERLPQMADAGEAIVPGALTGTEALRDNVG
jgi:hypothetical protein